MDRRRGDRLLLCADARHARGPRAPPRSTEVAGGASGRNGGFACAARGAVRRGARRKSAATVRGCVMGLTERALDRMAELAGDALRRVGSLRLACDERRARRAAARARRAARGRLRGRVGGGARRAARPALPRRDPAPARRGALPGPLGAAARARMPQRRARNHEGRSASRSTSWTPTRSSSQATDSPASSAARARARRSPDAGQVLATEPLRERLYERPHYARGGYDYWHQLPTDGW